MTLPLVSCLCPTYNRAPDYLWLLGEAVESFLRQDYPGPKELVILNDTPGQKLECDAPEVWIYNIPYRCKSLGHKRNALAKANGSILLPWDDDDISLSHRISQAVVELGSSFGYFNPGGYWFIDSGTLKIPGNMGCGHNSSAFTREAFDLAGGYPLVSGTEDVEMDRRLRNTKGVYVIDGENTISPERWSYCYRWGVSPRHLSGRRNLDQHYADIGTYPVQQGTFRIEPAWRQNYSALVDRYLAGR